MKIAISGLSNNDNPAPGIPIVKSLKDEHQLIGLSYDINETGNFLGLLDKTYLMPYPSLGFEELQKRLAYIKEQENIEMIIPNLDAELPLYIKYQQQINEMGILLCLPSEENFALRNKNKLDTLAKQLNITYPKIDEVNSIDELINITKNCQFPLMIKGNYYKAYKVDNLDSAIIHFNEIANEWGLPILVQEVVSGEEINLVGIADGEGCLTGAVAIKKLTTTSIGKIWTGITIHNEMLMNVAIDFAKQTNWLGPFELECIINHNTVYLIEINPRFPAWVYFATQVGINLPKMLVAMVKQEKLQPQLKYPANKMYIRYTEEHIVDFENFSRLISKKEL